ncbi:PREDICTED: LOW QUALITY PROTEIN: uncharacterized protein LOC108574589 [Habropoda laboriosa]|uniref:LOW QUALITY PROTEIN: uncharacterized protein LOC108574589 n=1 Tax=Habropoda laboriosa TaxID=597456 RepID=UPI00083D8E10|nr:PREDICTED: LOW QUALITY PROTEIN: uncharacterized protein LOC108574589 [Habropoda laboriosa]
MQATLLNYGGQHGFGRCSVASQGSLEEDECDSSEELIGSASGGGQSESQSVGLQPKLTPISGSMEPTTVFRLHFLGSVEVEEEGRRKRLNNNIVREAVTKIKVRPPTLRCIIIFYSVIVMFDILNIYLKKLLFLLCLISLCITPSLSFSNNE